MPNPSSGFLLDFGITNDADSTISDFVLTDGEGIFLNATGNNLVLNDGEVIFLKAPLGKEEFLIWR